MTAAISKPQIGAIHAMAKRIGLDDGTYRRFLETETGKRSSKDLTRAEADRVLDRLKQRAGPYSKRPRKGLDGPYAPKLQALWISAWHLGLTRDRRDSALLKFVRRQTGVEHTRWLREPYLATRAIEGLKAWMQREAGVRWDAHPQEPKRAIVEAQLRMLRKHPAVPAGADLDALMQAFGEQIREQPREMTA